LGIRNAQGPCILGAQKCGGLAPSHEVHLEGPLPPQPSQPGHSTALTLSHDRLGEHRPLAGQFRRLAENHTSAPPNHQTAEYAKTRKEVWTLCVSGLLVFLWLMQAMAPLPRAASCCWAGYPQDAARHPKLSSGLVVDPSLPSVLGPRSSGPVPRAFRSLRKICITNAPKLRALSVQLPAPWSMLDAFRPSPLPPGLHAPCPLPDVLLAPIWFEAHAGRWVDALSAGGISSALVGSGSGRERPPRSDCTSARLGVSATLKRGALTRLVCP